MNQHETVINIDNVNENRLPKNRNISPFNHDVLFSIMQYLSLNDVNKFALVNKGFYLCLMDRLLPYRIAMISKPNSELRELLNKLRLDDFFIKFLIVWPEICEQILSGKEEAIENLDAEYTLNQFASCFRWAGICRSNSVIYFEMDEKIIPVLSLIKKNQELLDFFKKHIKLNLTVDLNALQAYQEVYFKDIRSWANEALAKRNNRFIRSDWLNKISIAFTLLCSIVITYFLSAGVGYIYERTTDVPCTDIDSQYYPCQSYLKHINFQSTVSHFRNSDIVVEIMNIICWLSLSVVSGALSIIPGDMVGLMLQQLTNKLSDFSPIKISSPPIKRSKILEELETTYPKTQYGFFWNFSRKCTDELVFEVASQKAFKLSN